MKNFTEWPPAAKVAVSLLALVLLGLLWSVIASVGFLALTGMLTRDTLPLAQWWLYALHYGPSHPTVGTPLKISGGIATALPLLMILAALLRGGRLPPHGLHGTTRWATLREAMKAGLYGAFRGLYVARDARGRYLRFSGPEHVACYAPTRSGKGVGLVIPNCMLWDGTLICLDVKKENWAATAGIRAEAGQKVFLFDPLAPDGRTARYNPFTYVRRGTIDAFDDIQRIAQMVFPHAAGDQQFWTDAARSAFVGAAAFLAETPEMPLTFGEVLRLLSSSDGPRVMNEHITARRLAGRPYTEATVKALEDYLKGSADLVNSIRKTVTARLSLWFNPRIDAATSESDFDLRELRHSLHAIYLGVTPDNIARLRPLLALFFQQFVDLAVRVLPQHDPSAKHGVLLLLDEFPLLGPMPMLADAFAYLAGYDIRMMLVMQSKAQLRDRDLYGPDKATAILENCGLEVVFGTKDLKLSEELSARLGYDTVEGASRSGPRFWRALRRDRLNLTQTDQRRALLLPQEVTRLGPTEVILLRPGTYPVRAWRIRYYEEKLFASLRRQPPVVPPIDVHVRMDTGRGFRPAEGDGTDTPAPPPPRPSRPPARRRPKPAAGSTPPSGSITVVPPSSAPLPPATAEPPLSAMPALRPHQADGLLNAILGAEVDLSSLGLADGKAAVASIVDAVPTVGRPGGAPRLAAE